MDRPTQEQDQLLRREAIALATISAAQFGHDLFIVYSAAGPLYGIFDKPAGNYFQRQTLYRVTPDGAVIPERQPRHRGSVR